MKKPVILVAEEDDSFRQDLKRRLLLYGFEVLEAPDQTDVLHLLQDGQPDLIIFGFSRKSSRDGLEGLVEPIRQHDRRIPIILITAHSSEAQAIAALKAGVNDYFVMPFSYEELAASIKRSLFDFYKPSSTDHKIAVQDYNHNQFMIGNSIPMQEVKGYLKKVAATDSTVLITGETGTGKELAAELIHRNSPRHEKPFCCINCAALPDSLLESELFGYERGSFTGAVASKRGKFELAIGGTVFLDEIGDMSPFAQAKILRAVERKEVHRLGGGNGGIPVDIRIISATNQDPERLVKEGKFRKDLYYRLNVARVHMPTLRDRKEDLPRLMEHFIQELNRQFCREVEGFTEEALSSLLLYDWSGNVRELKNLIEATFINLPFRKITFMDLPKQFQRRLKEADGLPGSERDRVVSALLATNWNKSKAAQKLHWSRMTLYRKMNKYHIMATSKPGMKGNRKTGENIVTL